MGKLSEVDIRRIVQKASLLQKFGEGSSSIEPDTDDSDLQQLYSLTDDLGIDRTFVYEAYLEQGGIQVQEPILVDHPDFNMAETMGYAKGSLDKGVLNELRGQLEYHFNTMGNFSHRRNKIVWNAKPSGISRYIASSNSPEADFIEHGDGVEIRLRQSLKTTHKLYVPNVILFIIGFMMFAGGVIGQDPTDSTPLMVIGGLFVFGSYLFSRFVANRRNKKKKKLTEITEILQRSIERRLKAKITRPDMEEEHEGRIVIPEEEHEEGEAKNSHSTASSEKTS